MTQRSFVVGGCAHNARQLGGYFCFRQATCLASRRRFIRFFACYVMMIGIRSNLRKMRYTKDLMPQRKLMHLSGYGIGDHTGNAGIDFVKDQRFDPIRIGQCNLQCQHNAGNLTAGRDLMQRLYWFTTVGGKQKLDLIYAVFRQFGSRNGLELRFESCIRHAHILHLL